MKLFSHWMTIIVIMFSMTPALAQNVTLQWDPNTEPDIAGYKIYYNADSVGLPFAGTGAAEGSSPVDVGNLTTATITGLDPAKSYYFAVTAYDADGYESSFSNIVSSLSSGDTVSPVVTIKSPAAGSSILGTATISVIATDNTGVTRVALFVDNSPITTLQTAPYDFSYDTQSLANGAHTFTVRAYDAAENVGEGSVTATVANDKTAPVVSFIAPAAGTAVSGTVSVTVDAVDNVGVSSVAFLVDGSWKETDMTSPFAFSWDSTLFANGIYTLSAMAFDAAGNSSQINLAVTVANDTVPPTISVTAPAAGAVVSGTIPVAAGASDNVAVAKVEFYVDGILKATRTSAPFSFAWDTKTVANGAHTITAYAYDAAKNIGMAQGLPVSVKNDLGAPAVTVSAPVAGATVSGAVTVSAAAVDDMGVTKIEFYLDGVLKNTATTSPYSYSWDTKTTTNAAHSLTAKAYDAAGNIGTSAAVSVTVFNDVTAPAAKITVPTAGSTVMGVVAIGIQATDDVAVAKAEFYLDGRLLGTVASAPFTFVWDTNPEQNGSYSLSAKVYDAAGNMGVTSAVAVTIFNDKAVPTVVVAGLGKYVGGTVNVVATASDNVRVSRVEFFLNDALIVSDGTSPFGFSWNTTSYPDGAYTITAKAYDEAGNVAVSLPVKTQVYNAVPAVIVTSPRDGSKFRKPPRTTTGLATDLVGTNLVQVTVDATAEPGIVKVNLYVDGLLVGTKEAAPFVFSWDTTNVNGVKNLTAKAYDAVGNSAESAKVSVLVSTDVNAPTIRISSPKNGRTVTGVVPVSVSVKDPSGIAKLDFFVDGSLVYSHPGGSYTFRWDTAGYAQGKDHVVRVVAYDKIGNLSESSVTVKVKDIIPPAVVLSVPASMSAAVGSVEDALTISASATDNVGVVKMRLYVDGKLKGQSLADSVSFTWPLSSVRPGKHTIMAIAYDDAGKNTRQTITWIK